MPGAVGLRDPPEQRQRLVVVPVGDQQLGEGDDGVLVRRLHRQRDAQAALVAGLDQLLDRDLLLGGLQRVDEALHLVFGVRPDEPVDDRAVLEGVHGGDRLRLEGLGDAGVLVDVDLGQHDLAVGGVDHLLDDRPQGLAGSAPGRPQVDDDRHLLGLVDDFCLERGVGDVDCCHDRHATGAA